MENGNNANANDRKLNQSNCENKSQKKLSPAQKLYDTCKEVFADCAPGIVPSPINVERLKNVLDSMTAADVGIDSRMPIFGMHTATKVPIITYLELYECDQFSIGIFCLPPEAVIPLHNHPGMTVFSKLLFGTMKIKGYDFADTEGATVIRTAKADANAFLDKMDPGPVPAANPGLGEMAPGPVPAANPGLGEMAPGPVPAANPGLGEMAPVLILAAKPGLDEMAPGPVLIPAANPGLDAANCETDKAVDNAGKMPVDANPEGVRLAKLKVDTQVAAPCETAILYPADGGNIHCFRGITPCCVLEVLSPPYQEREGRHCQYYSEFPFNKFAVEGSSVLEEAKEKLAWLLEREEPEDLLIFGARYNGPNIVTN